MLFLREIRTAGVAVLGCWRASLRTRVWIVSVVSVDIYNMIHALPLQISGAFTCQEIQNFTCVFLSLFRYTAGEAECGILVTCRVGSRSSVRAISSPRLGSFRPVSPGYFQIVLVGNDVYAVDEVARLVGGKAGALYQIRRCFAFCVLPRCFICCAIPQCFAFCMITQCSASSAISRTVPDCDYE